MSGGAVEPVGIGATVGRYVVVERIAGDETRASYTAWDPDLDRRIALALVRDEDAVIAAASALAKLDHPNIVTVHDVGTVRDQVFIATELVEGETLRAWLGATPRSRSAVLEVLLAAGRGLAAAHECGLVHGELGPDSVMIDGRGRVVISGFGLVGARVVEGDGVARLYAAPEQLDGAPAEARSDQFSFCVMAWEALVGEHPFVGETTREPSLAIRQSRRRAASRVAGVPRHVRAALDRGLDRAPQGRHPSVAALLVALRTDPWRAWRRVAAGVALVSVVVAVPLAWQAVAKLRRDRASEACAEEAAALVQAWTGRRAEVERAFVATGAGHAADSFARTAAWLDGWTATAASERAALCLLARLEAPADPVVHAARLACFDEQRDRLAALVDVIGDPSAITMAGAAKSATTFAQSESCTDPQTIVLRPTPPMHAVGIDAVRIGLARAQAFADAGDYPGGAEAARAALAAAEQIGWRPLAAEARLATASIESELGNYAECARQLVLAYRDASASGYDLVAARSAIMLARVEGYHRARSRDALEWGHVAAAWLARLGRSDGLDAAQLANNTGLVYEASLELEQAERWHGRALAARERLLGTEHPETGHSHGNLGNVALARGDYDTALARHRRALEVRIAGLGPSHPDVARSHANIGRVFVARGDTDQALEHFATAFAILARTVGEDHRVAARVLNGMGDAYFARGELERARDHHARALALQSSQLGDGHLETAESAADLGRVLHALGDDAAALVHLRAAMSAYERELGGQHRLTLQLAAQIEEASERSL
jgi:tetratricopeptide (TPR) repeat protein/tRNA A-37 threonylcarbamoyl transferase component Bud32